MDACGRVGAVSKYHYARAEGKRDYRGRLDQRRNHRGNAPDTRARCTCSAYRYPHLYFVGRCRPQAWVDQFFGSPDCADCINLDDGACQVVSGTEVTFHCPALREFVRYEGIVLYGRARSAFERAQHE